MEKIRRYISSSSFKSDLALGASLLALLISYLAYRNDTLPPHVSTRLTQFAVTGRPVTIQAKFDVSISNLSSRSVYIIKCEIAINGIGDGGGGYTESFIPCKTELFDEGKRFEIASGATEFFSLDSEIPVHEHDEKTALSLMGIDVDDISERLEEGPCVADISTRRTGASASQNCSLIQRSSGGFLSDGPSQQVLSFVLQDGTGNIIRTPIYLSLNQVWPWGA